METWVKQDPLDLAPKRRHQRFLAELAETPKEDRLRLLQRYIDPNAPTYRGKVTVGDDKGAQVLDWRQAQTRPGSHTELRQYVTRVPEGTFRRDEYKPRLPAERVESMAKRYLKMFETMGAAGADGVLTEIAGEYWKQGQPVSMEALRDVARRELEKVERKMRVDHKSSTRPAYLR